MLRKILMLILATAASNCYSQALLSVEWQKVLCNKNGDVYAIHKDNNEDTYTLGSFGGPANCFGEYLSEDSGDYFFIKQASNGEKLLVKRFGGNEGYSFGDMKICSNGDIILGLTFTNKFFLNGTILTTSMKSCDIILRLDHNFNLQWFKTFPSNNITYINKLILDSHENIYASVLFADSITINGNVYNQNQRYGSAIVKINPEGNVEWSHHFYAKGLLLNQILKISTSCNSCPSTIFIGGNFGEDSIFINGSLEAKNHSKFYQQQFVSILNEYGDILQTKILDEGIRSIIDIDFYEGKIFFAGSYTDTVDWNDTHIVPTDTSSMYIGELNSRADLIGFRDIKSSNSYHSYLTSFSISPIYGFVLSGVFEGNFHLQSSSITLGSTFKRGAIIANLDEWLKLVDIKYVTGDNFNLNCLAVSNHQIVAAVQFTEICNFQNQTSTAPYTAIANFQTTDLNQLNGFYPNPFSTRTTYDSLSVQICPNPFKESFKLKFSEPIYSTSLKVTNSVGQICKDISITKINDLEVIIEAKELSEGLYFIQYLTCSNSKGIFKILKVAN